MSISTKLDFSCQKCIRLLSLKYCLDITLSISNILDSEEHGGSFQVLLFQENGGGESEKAKTVAITGRQKGELLERGGNVGDIVAGREKGGTQH